MLLGGYCSPFVFLTSVTKRGIHLFRFCVSGLSNRFHLFVHVHFWLTSTRENSSKPKESFHHCLHFIVFQRAAKAFFSSHGHVLFWLFWTRYLKIRVFVLHRARYHTNPNETGVGQRFIQAKQHNASYNSPYKIQISFKWRQSLLGICALLRNTNDVIDVA